MVHLLPFMATAALLRTAASAPATEKSIKDIVIEVFGPTDTWTPRYFKDIGPTATIDENPINDSVIYAYAPPTDSTLTQAALSCIAQRSTQLERRSTSPPDQALDPNLLSNRALAPTNTAPVRQRRFLSQGWRW